MTIHTNRLLLTLGMVLLTCVGRAQTMIDGSESLSLDTITGMTISVRSDWSQDRTISLWLSTRWDETDDGVLTVNGVKRAVLSAAEEQSYMLAHPAASDGTYDCEWRVGETVYRRTVVMVGSRKVAFGGELELDTQKVRRASATGAEICYDVQWIDGATTAVISCVDEELVRGASGVYTWFPKSAGNHVLTLSLQDCEGREIAHESASFKADAAFARIDGENTWKAGLFDGCVDIREVVLDCDLTSFALFGESLGASDLLHRWSFNGDLSDSVGGQTAVAYGDVVCGEDRCTLAGGSNAASYIDLGDSILPVSDAGSTIEIWGTRHSSQSCSRVIDINSRTSDYLFWGWQNGDQVDDDSFGIAAINGSNDQHSGVPFEQDVEYHLSIVIQKTSSCWTAKFVKRESSTGGVLSVGEIDSSGKAWSPASLRQTNCWLGRSAWSTDRGANASYNEVRVWNRALTGDELSRNAVLGPDASTDQAMICMRLFPDSYANLSNVVLGAEVTELPDWFFAGCVSLKDVVIPSAVTAFGDRAFADCAGLSSITITSSVTNIGANAFVGCTGIKSVELYSARIAATKTLRELFPDSYANLTNVVLGAEVTALADGFFDGCTALVDIWAGRDWRQLGEQSGKQGLWVENGWVLGYIGDAPPEVTIPEGVVGIAACAFEGQAVLESVAFPSSLRSIGVRAFARCTSLERLDLPDGVGRIDDAAFQDCTFLQELTLPSGLKRLGDSAFANCTSLSGLVCAEDLVEIGEAAFSNCWRMLSVSVPASLEKVGENAFFGCSRLTGATVPTHVKPIAELLPDVAARLTDIAIAEGETALVPNAFAGCSALTRIALPPSLTEIPDGAFRNCAALSEIAIPAGVVRIGDEAFSGCSGLSELALPSCLTNIGTQAFAGLDKLTAVAIPPSVTVLGAGAFAACPNVQTVSLPGNVATVATVFSDAYATALVSASVTGTAGDLMDGLFESCAALKSVTVPTCVTNIGARAFRNCAQLAPFALWEGLVSIGAEAFRGVETLLSVAIPDSVTFVGADAFADCPNIRAVTMPVGLCSLASAFAGEADKITSVTLTGAGTEIPDGYLWDCAAVSSVTIPEGVTAIGADAFRGTSLASVEIPSTVATIGAGAFAGLDLLTELTLPASLQSVGDGAFADCSRLASLVIPAGVTELGANVFNGCAALKAVYFLSATAPAVAAETCAGTADDLVSYVVKGSTGWDGLETSKALPQAWPAENGRAIAWWEPNVFEVTFLGNGGEPASQTVSETTGATYVMPSVPPVRVGATFAGWWTEPVNGGQVKVTTKVGLTRPHTLYAHWRGHVYEIAFDLNGAAGALSSLSMEYGEAKTLPSCTVRRRDFDFAGWALSSDADTADFADGAEVVNLTDADGATVTLYAVWTPRTWTAANCLNAEGLTFTAAGDADWTADYETTHDGVASMRSGALGKAPEGEKVRSTLKTSVRGNGTLSFWWKVICEPSDSETGDLFDYLELTVDGERLATVEPIAGATNDWAFVTVRIDGGAEEHEVSWSFVKDDWDEAAFADVAWVDEVTWTPDPVTLTFAANGATGGDAPEDVVSACGETVILPGVGSLVCEGCSFVGWSDGERTYAAGASFVVGAADVAFTAVWREMSFGDVLNAPALAFETDGDAVWTFDAEVSHDGVASLRSGAVAAGQTSWVETSVTNAGTLAFWWKADGILYRGKPANYVEVAVDGIVVANATETDWANVSVEVAESGAHTVRWTYVQTRTQTEGEACAWLDEVTWTPAAPVAPTVEDDDGATVTGDAEAGFVLKPSEGATVVVVTIPDGVDAAKVTVKVSPETKRVTPNGAAVKVMRGKADITDYLDIPSADASGVIDLNAATVKEEIMKEPLDAAKGAVIDLASPSSPSLTTAPTREGLVYRLKEGATLEAMEANTTGDSTVGDGNPWTPTISVTGGTSGFYTIRVTK